MDQNDILGNTDKSDNVIKLLLSIALNLEEIKDLLKENKQLRESKLPRSI